MTDEHFRYRCAFYEVSDLPDRSLVPFHLRAARPFERVRIERYLDGVAYNWEDQRLIPNPRFENAPTPWPYEGARFFQVLIPPDCDLFDYETDLERYAIDEDIRLVRVGEDVWDSETDGWLESERR